MKKFIFALLILSTSLIDSFAYALIPTSKTILSRAARQHGKGAYVVEQDVTIKAEGEPIVLREKWTVVNAEVMRVSVSRKGAEDVKLELTYRGGKRTFTDSLGTTKSIATSPEFIEPYFYFRTLGSFQSALVKAKIVPPDFGQQPRKIVPANPKDKSESAVMISVDEPYVRLSRTGGVAAYELGKLTDNPSGNPGAWIESEAFALRKIKFPTLSEVQADQYQTFANQLHFPRERTIKWSNQAVNYTATARVISIRAATDSEASKNLSSVSENSASKLPEIPGLKEFYSRFR